MYREKDRDRNRRLEKETTLNKGESFLKPVHKRIMENEKKIADPMLTKVGIRNITQFTVDLFRDKSMDWYIQNCGVHGLGPEKIRLLPGYGIELMHSYYAAYYKDSKEIAKDAFDVTRGGVV